MEDPGTDSDPSERTNHLRYASAARTGGQRPVNHLSETNSGPLDIKEIDATEASWIPAKTIFYHTMRDASRSMRFCLHQPGRGRETSPGIWKLMPLIVPISLAIHADLHQIPNCGVLLITS